VIKHHLQSFEVLDTHELKMNISLFLSPYVLALLFASTIASAATERALEKSASPCCPSRSAAEVVKEVLRERRSLCLTME
jgi:hypothetical protein